MFWIIISTVIASLMAVLMTVIRLKASKRPASTRSILLPPLFMGTGALMFLFPQFQVKWIQVLEALSVGILFSIPLIKTSTFKISKRQIYLIPSKAFIFVLIGLLLIRIVFKLIIGSTISVGETSGMFYILAIGMIFTWRLAMFYRYKQLENKLRQSSR